jgi:prepilin-type N-terminal cleavage/methylation domain-containing protein
MRKNGKKAFTLIEVIVVVALVGIVGTAIVSMIVPTSNVFRQLSEEVETKMKAGQIMQALVPQIRYAGELVIEDNVDQVGSDPNKRYLYTQDGKVYLYMDGASVNLLTDEFYDDCAVDFRVSKLENNLLEVTLVVTQKSGDSRSELVTSVRVLNTQEVGGTEGYVLEYTWNEVPVATDA